MMEAKRRRNNELEVVCSRSVNGGHWLTKRHPEFVVRAVVSSRCPRGASRHNVL